MPSKKKSKAPVSPSHWDVLKTLIVDYTDAMIADSWKGGGDPVDAPIIEAQLLVARLKLETHLEKMQRDTQY